MTSISDLEDGLHAGGWSHWEFSGTASVTATSESVTAGQRVTVTSDNNLTIGTSAVVAGLLVESAIGSSATVNGDTSAIYMRKESTKLDWEYGITMNLSDIFGIVFLAIPTTVPLPLKISTTYCSWAEAK